MYPAKFTERLRQQEYINASQLEAALNSPSPVSIRLNRAKWNSPPKTSEQVIWCKDGYYLGSRPSYTLDPLYQAGCYYPQEASSMFLEEVFEQVAGEKNNLRVLDLCGAPGGKSTHLSSLIGENGFLVANDVIKPRAGILAENITRHGIGNAIVTNNDPLAFNGLKEYFDLILVDAPCSGEGMFGDPTAISEWSVENAALCSERQRRIVMDVWPSLKENGILIYSTCTFNPGENEENIKWLTGKTAASSVLLDISKYEGIQEIGYKGITGYGFHPGKIKGEGLFFSVIKKPGGSYETKKQSFRKNDNQLTNNDLKIAGNLINTSLINLYRHGDIVYKLSLPVEEYQFLKNHLRIIKGGTSLYKNRKDDFTPLHELALFCNLRKNAFPSVELDLSQSISFLKKENLILRDIPRGWILIKYRNANLGFIKNLGTRLNNYYPTDWRIRMNVPNDIQQMLIEWDMTDSLKMPE